MASPWVLLDFGGVVLTMKDKAHYRTKMLEVIEGIGFPVSDPAVLKKRVYGGPEFAEAKVGRISSFEMWSRIFNDANPLPSQLADGAAAGTPSGEGEQVQRGAAVELDEQTVERYRDYVRLEGRHVDARLVAYVQRLQARGVCVGVLSNYESDLLQVMEGLGVRELFGDGRILLSHDLGCAKPKLAAFHAALQRLSIPPVVVPREEVERVIRSESGWQASVGAKDNDCGSSGALCGESSLGAANGAPCASQPSGTHSAVLSPLSLSTVASSGAAPQPSLDGSGVLHDGLGQSISSDMTSPMLGGTSPSTSSLAGPVAHLFPNVVFVDDKESNVLAAKQAGIVHSILYTSIETCIAEVDAALRRMSMVEGSPK